MSDRDRVLSLLTVAREDADALAGMKLFPTAFSDQIFGFHAQQAVEKLLKAWIAFLGIEYPYTHNLLTLMTILKDAGENPDTLPPTDMLINYAVMFRYEPDDAPDGKLDREDILARVETIYDHVLRRVSGKKGNPT